MALLRRAVTDATNDAKRTTPSENASRIERKLWFALAPSQFAHEQLVSKGRSAVPILLQIIADSSQPAEIRDSAWHALICIGDPDVWPAFARAVKSKLLDRELASNWLWRKLLCDLETHPTEQKFAAIMDRLDRGDGLAQTRLELFDQRMRSDEKSEGFELLDPALHWFNRLYADDVDQRLAEEAPDALAFRIRELAKGYDPLTTIGLQLAVLTKQGLVEKFATVYPDPQRAVASKLCFLVHVEWMDEDPPPGWQKKLRNWYWANRARFTYDASRRRFVLPTGATRPNEALVTPTAWRFCSKCGQKSDAIEKDCPTCGKPFRSR